MRELTEEIKKQIELKARSILIGSPEEVIQDYIQVYEQAWINGEVEV